MRKQRTFGDPQIWVGLLIGWINFLFLFVRFFFLYVYVFISLFNTYVNIFLRRACHLARLAFAISKWLCSLSCKLPTCNLHSFFFLRGTNKYWLLLLLNNLQQRNSRILALPSARPSRLPPPTVPDLQHKDSYLIFPQGKARHTSASKVSLLFLVRLPRSPFETFRGLGTTPPAVLFHRRWWIWARWIQTVLNLPTAVRKNKTK